MTFRHPNCQCHHAHTILAIQDRRPTAITRSIEPQFIFIPSYGFTLLATLTRTCDMRLSALPLPLTPIQRPTAYRTVLARIQSQLIFIPSYRTLLVPYNLQTSHRPTSPTTRPHPEPTHNDHTDQHSSTCGRARAGLEVQRARPAAARRASTVAACGNTGWPGLSLGGAGRGWGKELIRRL